MASPTSRPRPRLRQGNSRALTLITIVVVLFVLYLARAVLIPIALAILLTFVLSPAVSRLERWGLGRLPATLLTVAVSTIVVGALAWVMLVQAIDLADQLPQYKHNFREKVDMLVSGTSSGLERVKRGLDTLGQEVMNAAEENGPEPAPEIQSDQPTPVVITGTQLTPWQSLQATIRPAMAPFINAAIVIVFVVYMLLQSRELGDRVIRLLGEDRLTLTSQAMAEAGSRVSRYLQAALIINIGYAILASAGLLLIGVPNALLWGLLSIALRFIPIIGAWFTAAMPIVLSMAVFDSWWPPLLTVALFVVLESVSEYVFEPWLYGSRTGVSKLAILFSALFWGWIWGPVGLVLATPMTVCLVVIGRQVTSLGFLVVLLGDEPVLPPMTQLYLRLLSLDQEAALRMASEHRKTHTLAEFYDDLLVPALVLAERDRHRGRDDDDRHELMYELVRDLIGELGEQEQQLKQQAADHAAAKAPPAGPAGAGAGAGAPHVLCIPARDEADELIALMLVQLLNAEGVAAETLSVHSLAGEALQKVQDSGTDLVCVSALPPHESLHARYLCKRLLERFPDLRIVAGLWHGDQSGETFQSLKSCGSQAVVATLADAMGHLRR